MPTAAATRRPTPTLRPPPVPAWPRRMVSSRTVAPPTSEKRSQRWYGTASTTSSWPVPDFSRPTKRAPRGAVNAPGWSFSRRSSSAASNWARSFSGSWSKTSFATCSGERRVTTPRPLRSPVLGVPSVRAPGPVEPSSGSASGLISTAGSRLPSSKVTVRGAGPGGRASSPVSSRAGRCRSSWVSSGTGSPRSGVSSAGLSRSVTPPRLRSHSPKTSGPAGSGVAGAGTGGGVGVVAGAGRDAAGTRASKWSVPL